MEAESTDELLKGWVVDRVNCSIAETVHEYYKFIFDNPGDREDDISWDAAFHKKILSEVLQKIGAEPPRVLIFDDIACADLLSSEDWEAFFTSLLSNSSHDRPYRLTVQCTSSLFSTVCTHVGHFLAKSCTLDELYFEPPEPYRTIRRWPSIEPDRTTGTVGSLSSEAVQALSKGLAQTKCLRILYVYRGEGELLDVFTRAFGGNVQNTSLEYLIMDPNLGGLEKALPVLLSSSSYEKLKLISLHLQLEDLTETTPEKLRAVGKCLSKLRRSDHVDPSRKVELFFSWCQATGFTVGGSERVFSCLDNLVEASERAPMLELNLSFEFTRPMHEKDIGFGVTEKWLLRALDRYNQFSSLTLGLCFPAANMNIDYFVPFWESIKSNESVESLTIKTYYLGPREGIRHKDERWIHLFECLKNKRRLRELYFHVIPVGDGAFRSLMDLLQVNIYLEKIDLHTTGWELDGKELLVRDALERNRAQAAYFSTFSNASFVFGKARACRLFLCGNPQAGKTTLRATMMKRRQKRSWVEKSWIKLRGPKRTKGIDVELLRDDEEMQISIWDLAGQKIFRSLQTLLLPTITQACVFAFVFSPVKDDHEQMEMKDDVQTAFRDELESWLRFIASNYPVTGTYLPELLVVITHEDFMARKHIPDCEWATKIIDEFRSKFQNALHLSRGEELYYVNAQKKEKVQPFTEHVLSLFSDLLQRKTPQAPEACSKLISQVLQRPKEMTIRPVWNVQDFHSFVSKRLEALGVGCFRPEVEEQRKVLEAVTFYMHDVGSIFFLRGCGLVVVDINWLTHDFLGKLISEGHNFEVKPKAHSSPDGFVSKSVLDATLRELSQNNHRRKEVTVEAQVLEDLLINLDLCYHVGSHEGIDRFFVPTIFGSTGNHHEVSSVQRVLSWHTQESSSDWKHFGYRLLCQDRDTTSLTSAVFPRFQIHLYKKLRETSDARCVCERDVIRLDWNGYFIIVENDSVTGDHVDILVRYSMSKRREKAISFVKENVLEKFRKFCASPEGCRGVSLVVAIIRPECVHKLTRHEYRDDRVVVRIEQLRTALEKEVVKNLQSEEEGNDLLDYEHVWLDVPEAGLPKQTERAIDLLEMEDLQQILKTVEEEQNRKLLNLQNLSKKLDASSDAATDERTSQSNQKRMDDSSMVLTDLDCRETKVLKEIMSRLYREFDRIHEHLDEVHQGIQKDLAKILLQHREQHSTLLCIMSKMDNMLGYTEALERARVPRRPFLTVGDVGYGEKFRGLVQIGTPVRLHLMCESRLGPHIVENQPGLKLLLQRENREWLRWISINSLKTMWYLAKAGVHVMTSAGQLIPDFFDPSNSVQDGLLITDLTLDELKYSETPMDHGTGRSMITEEAWLLLKNRLPSTNQGIADNFKLYPVKYDPGFAKESYAWLCAECIQRGKKQLTVL